MGLKFGILDGISELMMLFGTFAISAGCTGLGYWLMKLMIKQEDRMVELTLAPMVVIFVASWATASLFQHVYDVSSDALLHCYAVDELTNGKALHLFESLDRAVRSSKNDGYDPLVK